MVIIKYKPTSPGRRHKVKISNKLIYKGKPFKSLLKDKRKTGGRNNYGRITMNHIGGGHKQRYRLIDFKRDKENILGYVKRIEYDPNRSAYIALIYYKDGDKRYILCPKDLYIGENIISGNNVDIKIGNCLPLVSIPNGSLVHNIELLKGKGGKLIRSAGSYAQIIVKDSKYTTLRLKSGELRKVSSFCKATLGEVSNSEHMLKVLGKAGCKRWLGVRPTVRGTAMNPVDHPHGGGEGRNFGKHPVSPYGLKTKGKKTRHNKRTSKFIVKHRFKKR